MIKVTLKNGTEISCEDPKEASQFIHSLYWRDFKGEKAEEKVIVVKKACKSCGGLLPGNRYKYCKKARCQKAKNRAYARNWQKKHPDYYKKPQESLEPTLEPTLETLTN